MTMITKLMKTKTIPAGQIKVHCLAIMDEVQARRQAVVITKRGKPVAGPTFSRPLRISSTPVHCFCLGAAA